MDIVRGADLELHRCSRLLAVQLRPLPAPSECDNRGRGGPPLCMHGVCPCVSFSCRSPSCGFRRFLSKLFLCPSTVFVSWLTKLSHCVLTGGCHDLCKVRVGLRASPTEELGYALQSHGPLTQVGENLGTFPDSLGH